MTNDPYRPNVDPDFRPNVDPDRPLPRGDLYYDYPTRNPRGDGLTWFAAAIAVAVIVAGLFFAFSVQDNPGVATNTPPTTAQQPTTVVPVPTPIPSTTTGAAPSDDKPTPSPIDEPPKQ